MKKRISNKNDFKTWRNNWKNEVIKHYKSIIFSLFLVILATIVNYNAGVYVTEKGSGLPGDFILDNVGPYDLSFSFIYFWLILVTILLAYPIIFQVNLFHKILAQFSFLIIVRSFFITLTHLKTPATAIYANFPGIINTLAFQNDLFFSGHTAVPFLGFLFYKGHKIRWFFLAGSIIMAVTVILMHQHYTIDVLAAYFITYGVFHLAKFFSPFRD